MKIKNSSQFQDSRLTHPLWFTKDSQVETIRPPDPVSNRNLKVQTC